MLLFFNAKLGMGDFHGFRRRRRVDAKHCKFLSQFAVLADPNRQAPRPCGFATVRLEALGSHRFETRYIVSFTIVSKKRSKITLRVPQNSQGIFALPLTFIGRLYFRL